MEANKLKMNDEKTELLCVGKSNKLKVVFDEIKDGLQVSGQSVLFSDSVRSLGVCLDSILTMEAHVRYLCTVLYLQLRRIGKIRHLLTVDATNKLCVSFILSRLDYCNALFSHLSAKHISKLQRIQNCAARLVLRQDKHCSATGLLKTLHWLPVRARVEYKLATLSFKCLSSSAHSSSLSFPASLSIHSHSDPPLSKCSSPHCPFFQPPDFWQKIFLCRGPSTVELLAPISSQIRLSRNIQKAPQNTPLSKVPQLKS